MFQTRFSDVDHKLIISWDKERTVNPSLDETNETNEDILCRLNELYLNIAKFSKEFVDCVKVTNHGTNLAELYELLHSTNPDSSLRIENVEKNGFDADVALLREEIKRLQDENRLSEEKHKEEIHEIKARHEEEMSNARLVLREELINKYNNEMSDLREYYEQRCTEFRKQFTAEISSQCDKNSDFSSNSESEANCIQPDDVKFKTNYSYSYEDMQAHKVKLKQYLDNDLRNIVKTYNLEIAKFKEELDRRKDQELGQIRCDLEKKYGSRINALEQELEQYKHDEVIENNVRQIRHDVMNHCISETLVLQRGSDEEYIKQIEDKNHSLEKKLTVQQMEMARIDEAWRSKMEETLSELLVESALKSVANEANMISDHSPQSSPTKKLKNIEVKKHKCKENIRQMKQKYKKENDELRQKCEEEINKLKKENDRLAERSAEFLNLQKKHNNEISVLKQQFHDDLLKLQSTQEYEIVENLRLELYKMKTLHDTEIERLNEEKHVLSQKIEELKNTLLIQEEAIRKGLIVSLEEELKELLDEKNEKASSWPDDLTTIKELLLKPQSVVNQGMGDNTMINLDFRTILKNKFTEDEYLELEKIFEERDGLRRVNAALNRVLTEFTKYLTNCEEELNNTLIGELLKLETSDEIVRRVHFAPNVSEIASSLMDDTHDLSEFQGELNSCLERLRVEAAAILRLTAKDRSQRHNGTQTNYVFEDYEKAEHTINVLQGEIKEYENQFVKMEEEINLLHDEISRLNAKINDLESIEGYGEGFDSLTMRNNNNNVVNKEQYNIQHDLDEIIEKVKEEARREKQDLLLQIESAHNKVKSFELFLEQETAEREFERDEFDKRERSLQDQLKEKERELNNMHDFGNEISNLEQQVIELSRDCKQSEVRKEQLETEQKAASAKIWDLREIIRELESKLAEKSELAENLSVKLREKENELGQQQQQFDSLRSELNLLRDGSVEQLEALRLQHDASSALIKKMKKQLIEAEKTILDRIRDLENMYLSFSSSNTVSSPSEDVSVCDRIVQQTRIVSPTTDSEISSSPGHVPNDLSCLFEKLKKLFRAEDVLFKKIHDQELELNKMTNSYTDMVLEKDTLHDNLTEVTRKFTELKIAYENLQHDGSADESINDDESYHNQLELCQQHLAEKDNTLAEYARKIDDLTSHATNCDQVLADYRIKINELQSELQRMAEEKRKFDESDHNARDLPALYELLDERNKTIEELRRSCERNNVRWSDKLVSYDDSDGYRNTISEVPAIPNLLPEVNKEKPKNNFVNPIVVPPLELTESFLPGTSMEKVFLDSESFDLKLDESLKFGRKPTHTITDKSENIPDQPTPIEETKHIVELIREIENLRNQSKLLANELDKEKKEHLNSLLKLREAHGAWNLERAALKDAENEYSKKASDAENCRRLAETDLQATKETLIQQQRELASVMKDLQMEQRTVVDLKDKLAEAESNIERAKTYEIELKKMKEELQEKQKLLDTLETELKIEKNAFRQMKQMRLEETENFGKIIKTVLKERINAEMKCEEYIRHYNDLKVNLEKEKQQVEETNKKLTNDLNTARNEIDKLEKTIQNLEIQKQYLDDFKDENSHLKIELEEARAGEAELKHQLLLHSERFEGGDRVRSGSLSDLTEKVQREVELAAVLDNNMMLSLSDDTKSDSLCGNLAGSNVTAEIKSILIKMLSGGFEGLSEDEKKMLLSVFNADEVEQLETYIQSNQELIRQLRVQADAEQKCKEDYISINRKLQIEVKRLEMVLEYYDERMSFLVSKLDEYRNKAVKMEIELITERGSMKQLEIKMENLKKQIYEKEINENKLKEEMNKQIVLLSNEKLSEKQQTEFLKNKIESLTAELNSMKVINQYNSDSEPEFSRTLNPLKERLQVMEEKYSNAKKELEITKAELKNLQFTFDEEVKTRDKLKTFCKEMSKGKLEYEQKFSEMKVKYENLSRQKSKLEEKLNSVELAEMKRRKSRFTNTESTKRENEALLELQTKMKKDCADLRTKLLYVTNESTTHKNAYLRVKSELQVAFIKILRLESYRRSLVYQKNYFCIQLSNCEVGHRIYLRKSKLLIKFRASVVLVMSLRRMKYLKEHRITHNYDKWDAYFKTQFPDIQINSLNFLTIRNSTGVGSGDMGEQSSLPAIIATSRNIKLPKINELPVVGGFSLESLYCQIIDLQRLYESEYQRYVNHSE